MIRFMTPDLAIPSGGIAVIYRYVELLNTLGYEAQVWHGTPGFKYPQWQSPSPVVAGRELAFDAGDILVVTEVGGGKWSFLNPRIPAVMLCQGVDFVFMDAAFSEDVPGRYPGWPQVVAAIGVSHLIVDFLHRACAGDLPIYRVPVEIEDYFTPRVKERRIALMPRRRHADLIGAVQLIRRSRRLGDWEIVPIDGMTRAQVAAELGRCAIFLFGAEREGFGLPGAEAMAAGCYVIGFTGDGAKEYMTSDAAGVIADSDVIGMCDATLLAMQRFDQDRDAFNAKVETGRSRVLARYSSAEATQALDSAFRDLTADGSPALLAKPAVLQHYSHYAPRGLGANGAYIASRRMVRRAINAWGRH